MLGAAKGGSIILISSAATQAERAAEQAATAAKQQSQGAEELSAALEEQQAQVAVVKAKEAELPPLVKKKAEAEEALKALPDKAEEEAKQTLLRQVAAATEALERAKSELGVLKEGKGLDRSRSRSPLGRKGAMVL